MANKVIATVNIVLRTATVSRAGFGTPIFIATHRGFQERIRSYASTDEVAEDFDTSSPVYVAATRVFSHDVSVSTFKVGRRESDSNTYTPENVEEGSVTSITVTVNDGDSVVASHTTGSAEDAEDIVTALAAAINGSAEVSAHVTAAVSGTGSSAVLTITPDTTTDLFNVSDFTNISEAYTTTETAADVRTAISEVDDDYYFVTAEDHSSAFIEAMADEVQSLEKMYFSSSQDNDSLTTAYSEASTDIGAVTKQNAYTRTAMIWDEEADTNFVELSFVGVNAPFSPDVSSVVWDGRSLPGISVAKNSEGNQIGSTAQTNLESRNMSYVINTSNGPRVVGGKVASGEWIDNIRLRDCMAARVQESLDTLILNQAGGKLPAGDVGIGLAEAAIGNALNRFKSARPRAINRYVINTDDAVVDPGTRELTGITFDAYLTGAIIRATINGTLSNEE